MSDSHVVNKTADAPSSITNKTANENFKLLNLLMRVYELVGFEVTSKSPVRKKKSNFKTFKGN